MVGKEDDDKLVKPKALGVLRDGRSPSDALADELKVHVDEMFAYGEANLTVKVHRGK